LVRLKPQKQNPGVSDCRWLPFHKAGAVIRRRVVLAAPHLLAAPYSLEINPDELLNPED